MIDRRYRLRLPFWGSHTKFRPESGGREKTFKYGKSTFSFQRYKPRGLLCRTRILLSFFSYFVARSASTSATCVARAFTFLHCLRLLPLKSDVFSLLHTSWHLLLTWHREVSALLFLNRLLSSGAWALTVHERNVFEGDLWATKPNDWPAWGRDNQKGIIKHYNYLWFEVSSSTNERKKGKQVLINTLLTLTPGRVQRQ